MSAATLDLSEVSAGFLDPARDSQSVFRKVMEAVARPGQVADLAFAVDGPADLACATAAVALTLFDFETPVWLDPSLHGGDAQTWLRFHAGCPIVEATRDAAFAIVTDATRAPALADFNQGDAKYPDQSTTLILQIEALDGGGPVCLRGPGIRGERTIAPVGLAEGFWDQVQANNARFQFGVDLILVAGSKLMALPRSTRVTPTGD